MEPEAVAAAAQAERLARLQGDAPAAVCAALEASLSPDPAVRTPAEASLRAAEGAPGFCSLLLQIATADGVAGHVQQAAALAVKNAVGAEGLAPAEREQVRGEILRYMAGLVGGAGGPRDAALGVAACRAAGCGGAAACATLVREAIALLGVGQPLLAILASLPDECAELAGLNGEVLETVGAVLAGQGADGQLPLVREAIRVLVSWLQGGGLTIDVLHDSGMMALLAPALLAPPLFSATAELFAGLCEGCGAASDTAATQLIITLMAQMVQLEAAVANEESVQFSLELANLLGGKCSCAVLCCAPFASSFEAQRKRLHSSGTAGGARAPPAARYAGSGLCDAHRLVFGWPSGCDRSREHPRLLGANGLAAGGERSWFCAGHKLAQREVYGVAWRAAPKLRFPVRL